MKFSITFKYSNVTFKNKETKETVTYDTKAEGNTFTFDNVDEDVVLGIVKGIKDKKASQVFAFDNLRTNFVNVIARNKCKELYDKLDKGEWKVEDVAISTATIKDLEFTKPMMNARENLTIESNMKDKIQNKAIEESLKELIDMCGRSNPMWSDLIDIYEKYFGEYQIKKPFKYWENKRKVNEGVYDNNFDEAELCLNEAKANLAMAREDIRQELGEEDELFQHIASNYNDVDDTYDMLEDYRYKNEMYGEKTMKESTFKDNMHKQNQDDLGELVEVVTSAIKDIDKINLSIQDETISEKLGDVRHKLITALPSTKTAKNLGMASESGSDTMDVIFKKDRTGEVTAFFPETVYDGSCNPGMIMCYVHNGQHSEASLDYFNKCRPCSEEVYADLLTELERIYDDVNLVVKKRAQWGKYPRRSRFSESRQVRA